MAGRRAKQSHSPGFPPCYPADTAPAEPPAGCKPDGGKGLAHAGGIGRGPVAGHPPGHAAADPQSIGRADVALCLAMIGGVPHVICGMATAGGDVSLVLTQGEAALLARRLSTYAGLVPGQPVESGRAADDDDGAETRL